MSHFILLHGFNDKDAGADNIDMVKPHLEARGHTVDTDGADYGWYSLLMVRFRKHNAVARIVNAIIAAEMVGADVIVVGYSNGFNYGLKALNLVYVGGIKLVGVHPAAPTRFRVPNSVLRVWIVYSRSDIVVRLSSYIRWLIPGWGRAGAVGYKGKDDRVVNLDYTDIGPKHGGIWRDESLKVIVHDLDRIAKEKV